MTNLALLRTPTAAQRRKVADKLAALMPRDAAQSAAAFVLNAHEVTPDGRRGSSSYAVHESGLNSLARERVYLPFVDPNHINFGRLITETPLPEVYFPKPTATEDGILTVTWLDRETQGAAIRDSVSEYLNTHALIPKMVDLISFNGLDSWHSPLVLVPVRHEYADGSPSQLRWMAADGTARLIAFRESMNITFPWLVDHEYMNAEGEWKVSTHSYADPHGNWNPDGNAMASWRGFLTAARVTAERAAQAAYETGAHADGIADDPRQHPEYFMDDDKFVQDWATLILPGPSGTNPRWDLEAWLLRTHQSAARAAAMTASDDDL